MRRTMLWGLVGVVGMQAGALAQFASDRPPAGQLPTFPTTAPPTRPPATTPFTPATIAQPTTQPRPPQPPHPWAVRPEYGGWFISVKSYTGERCRENAEQLAQHIRQTHNAGAYLFEWGAEERQKEEERQAVIRKQKQEEYAPFLAVRDQMKAKAAQEGTVFLDTPDKYHLGKVKIAEQWAVLVGGFKDMDAARQALDVIRKWPAPANNDLLDKAIIERGKDVEGAYFNPFKTAMVVPNPAVKRNTGQAPPADPALVKLNEEESLSLLKARKPWTLMVKRFPAPSRMQGREGSPTVLEKLFNTDETAKLLDANAKQARSLAEALRHPKMEPRPFEAFVLHGRMDTVVTVGQFDGPDDPLLAETWKALSNMTFKLEYKDGRPPEFKKMFDVVTPMQIPR